MGRLAATLLVAFSALSACRNSDEKACLAQYEAAQARVLQVDAKSADSVQGSLTVVESALAQCQRAERRGESDELVKAKNELVTQLALLERRAKRKPRREPTAEELKKLEKEGDATCPRGQAYKHEGSKEIRCIGPQLIDMTARQAQAYFEERDYRARAVPPATLEIERGSERYTLVYAKPGSDAAPECVVLYPAPGITWQEAVARATGANPARLKGSGNVDTARGAIPYSVDERNVVVRLGQCRPVL